MREALGLRELNLKPVYYSDEDDLLHDFYIPVLSNSVQYDRIAGYFSSNSLAVAARGMASFIKNGGKMRLITNVVLSAADQEAIREALRRKEAEVLAEIENMEDELKKDHVRMLAWMVKKGLLQIKIAVVQRGIEHQKIGILADFEGQRLVFTGSDNETRQGWLNNDEQFHVFCGWKPGDMAHLRPDVERFRVLWNDSGKRVRVYKVSEAFDRGLVETAPSDERQFARLARRIDRSSQDHGRLSAKDEAVNGGIEPWDFQEVAIRKWFENSCSGIFEMATGTGKTYTSLFCVRAYLQREKAGLTVIICCPYQHLVDQWAENVGDVFPTTVVVKCFESREKWHGPLNKLLRDVAFGACALGFVITTVDTGSSESFLRIVNTDKVKRLVIGDEVHNLGAPQSRNLLKLESDARLGLSATPIRPYDEEGNRAINQYFGSSVYTFSIGEAIRRGFLVPYNYYVTFCGLSNKEHEEYRRISGALGRLYSSKGPVDEESVRASLVKRAKVLSTASSKLPALSRILGELADPCNMLVFTAEDPAFFDRTLRILTEARLVTLKITSGIPHADRVRAIQMLTKKDIHCILAMRCLDEGVDIPSVHKAVILASSTNEKQYIQRRGRVLRKCGESKRYADIYDFFVVPPEFGSDADRTLYERELRRVLEFASCARNYDALGNVVRFSRQNALLRSFAELLRDFDI